MAMTNLVERTIRSSTTDGIEYVVRQTESKCWTCTCAGYKYRGTCDHLRLVIGVETGLGEWGYEGSAIV